MFLLKGKPVPDHTTIARYRSLHFAPSKPMGAIDPLSRKSTPYPPKKKGLNRRFEPFYL